MTDWQIMVHIIQGRDLPGLELNAYVSVQIDQQKRYTTIHKSSNSPYFGEVNHLTKGRLNFDLFDVVLHI
jgi:hypothetical protein